MSMTIAEKLVQDAANWHGVENTKDLLFDSIAAKGVPVPDGAKLADTPSLVDAIQTGGGECVGVHKVTWLDYDGTFIYAKIVVDGGDVDHPSSPLGDDYRIFRKWVGDNLNVTEDRYIMAHYDLLDGKSRVFVKINPDAGLQFSFKINKSDSSLVVIEWGDGTTDSNVGSGVQTLSHNYMDYGDFVVSISGTLKFGSWQSDRVFSGSVYESFIEKVYIAHEVLAYGFAFLNRLKSVLIKSGVTIATNAFSNSTINALIVPKPSGNTVDGVLRYLPLLKVAALDEGIEVENSIAISCNILEYIYLPSTLKIINGGFEESYSLKSIKVPSSVVQIYNRPFYKCWSLYKLTIPLTASVFEQTNYGMFYECRLLKSLIMKSLSGFIVNRSFFGCSSLEIVDIGETCSIIQNNPFESCPIIRIIIIRAVTPPTRNGTLASPYSSLPINCKIYVPDESVNAYKTTGTYWPVDADRIFPLSELII